MAFYLDATSHRAPPRRTPTSKAGKRAILSPPLHDLPELRQANAALTRAVLERISPELGHRPLVARKSPNWGGLLFGQVCGYRYAKRLSSLVRPVGVPLYRAEGVDGPFVRAAVLVREDDGANGLSDLRARRIAVDPSDLQSVGLLKAETAPLSSNGTFFSHVLQREGFGAATAALLAGEADAALIDAVLLAQLKRLRPKLVEGTRILIWTARTPAPPFITTGALPSDVSHQLEQALADIAKDADLKPVLDKLLIRGVQPIEGGAYRSALHFEQISQTLGYADLR